MACKTISGKDNKGGHVMKSQVIVQSGDKGQVTDQVTKRSCEEKGKEIEKIKWGQNQIITSLNLSENLLAGFSLQWTVLSHHLWCPHCLLGTGQCQMGSYLG